MSIDTRGIAKMLRQIDAGSRTEALRRVFKQWAVIYRGEMQQRFSDFSRGGGDWPKLAASTIRQRRHGKGGRHKRGARAARRAAARKPKS